MKLNKKALGAAIIEGSNMAGERLVTQIVTAYLEALGAEGWRDIKSAPKDGTEILLYGPGVLHSDGRTSMYARAQHVGWAQEVEGHLHWYTRDPRVTCRPIAWRPLPEPPSAMLSAAGGE